MFKSLFYTYIVVYLVKYDMQYKHIQYIKIFKGRSNDKINTTLKYFKFIVKRKTKTKMSQHNPFHVVYVLYFQE